LGPTFTNRTIKDEAPAYTPARPRSADAAWLSTGPPTDLKTGFGVDRTATTHGDGHALRASQDNVRFARGGTLSGRQMAVPRVRLLLLLPDPGPSDSEGPVPYVVRVFPPPRGVPPATTAISFTKQPATARRWSPSPTLD